MKKRAKERKLTRLILAALMATGGGLLFGAEAQAQDVYLGPPSQFGLSVDITETSKNSEGSAVTSNDYVFGNIVASTTLASLSNPYYFAISPSSIYKGLIGSTIYTGTPSATTYITGNWNGPASDCAVNMTGGTLGYLYGGYTVGPDVAASNNTVTISGGTVTDNVIGGYSRNGDASGNTVTVEAGATVDATDGGIAGSGGGTADNNTVIINGGTITDETHGGQSYSGAATNNKLTINNTDASINSYMQAGRAQTNATGNIFTVNGGEIGGGGIAGGYAATGKAEENQVVITNGTINTSVVGGAAPSGAANNNTVTISGGTIGGTVTGGESYSGNATGNIVTISGGDFTNANAAYSMVSGGSTNNGTASDNIVNILVPITLFGVNGGTGATEGTGNTVNIAAKDVVLTYNMYGVQNLNFYLPSDIANGDTMLTIKGESPWGEGPLKTDLTGVTFGVAALSGVSLAKNDTVNLITNPNGLTTDATLKTADSASLGTAEFLTANNLATDTKYTLGISKSGDNTIIATVENVTEESGGGSGGGTTAITAEDRLKSPVETRAAAVTLLNAGADMLASQGFAQAANAVALEAAEQAKNAEPGVAAPAASTFTPFAAFGGSSMRAESGSHVDTKGFGINVGFAKEFPNSQGKLLFGPVVEYGGGKYDSYNNDIHGDGNSHYWGVGVMARQVNHDGFYYEGSVRGGRVTSDYGANYPAGRVSYDSSSNYWAAHLGLGKVFAAGKKGTVDGYLKYFYSHQSGDDVTLNGVGERASFDSVDSNRIRVGARYTHKVNEMNSFYGGLAYQYEFGGEARAHYSVSGEAPSPSVKGSSGLLELGWQVKPGGPVTIDLGVTGWAGKQRGGSVQLGATWTF